MSADVAARNRASRRAGYRWQADLREYLRGLGLDVEELKLAGKQDEGDICVRLGDGRRFIIEAKNAAELDVAGFIREALVESQNYVDHRNLKVFVPGVAVAKARRKATSQAHVLMDLETFLKILGIELEAA